ncbi:MBG domain-containing protein [Reichenbachiella sp. MALMAid0571]|uniref:MBG domain-containing protein n=1 Tax=Reichenbachiella sp. MALMAid0571 TaxID=3143939 RepID=UPI0032DF3C38
MNNRILLFISFIVLSQFANAQQTYYWVGGPGNWSDLDEWATTSGGTERFGVLPGPTDNVVFDENSFIGNGNRVYVDVDAEMKDLTVTNLAYEYIVLDDVDGGKLSISGNVILEDNILVTCPMYFSSGNTSTFQNNGGFQKDGFSDKISLHVDGGGTLILQDSVAFDYANLSNSSILDINGQAVNFNGAVWVYDATLTSDEAAQIHLTGNRFNTQANSTIDLPTSTIYGVDYPKLSFFGGGHSYYRLVMPNATIRNNNTIEKLSSCNGELTIINENSIDSLIMHSSRLELSDNTTNTVEYLELKGTRSEFAEIVGGENQSTLDITNEASLSYCSFTNINITASETVVANNSLDEGNNSGFTINEITPLTYYWVGGSGDISDLAHWATSSGGSELHEDAFSKIDNILFDANSTDGNAVITSSEDIAINNFEMLGVTDSIEFDLKEINLYGLIYLSQTTISNLMTINFRGTDVTSHYLGNTDDNLFSLYFYDGEHSVSGDTLRAKSIFIDGGHAHLSDKYIDVEQLYNLSGRGEFQNSSINIDWRLIGNNEENGSDFTNTHIYLSDNENKYSTWPRIDISGDTLSYLQTGNEAQIFDSSYDTLMIPPGKTVNIYETIKVAFADINGEADNFIKLIGNNGAKFVSREEEDIEISYTELTNLPAEGATITADFSIDREGNDGWTFTNEILIPDVPTGLTAVDITHNSYKATWDEVEGAESYIFSYTTGGGAAGTNATEITDNFFEVNGNFSEWYVAAKNAAGTSNYSEQQQVTYTPNPPTIKTNYIQAVTASINYTRPRAFGITAYIDLALDEHFSTYVDGYQNFEVVIDNASTDNEDFIFESLNEETDYYCRIRLANETGTSPSSETLHFTTASKLTQSISFAEIPGKSILDESFDLEVSASSGLDVTIVSSNTNVASVNGKTVTIHSLGETTFTASQDGNNGFKAATNQSQILTVSKATQTITFTDMSKSYGDSNFTIPASIDSQLELSYSSSEESVAVIEGDMLVIIGVGSTEITASQAGNDVYLPTSKTQTLTVEKATLTITANNQTKIYGSENPELTFEYDGFVNNEDASMIDTPPTATATATEASAVGDYEITLSDGIDNNYDFNYVSGTLTIEKAPQTINFTTTGDKTLQDSPISLQASATSDLTVEFTLLEGDGVISGNQLTVNSIGTFRVEASQEGNDNYLAASKVEMSFEVFPDLLDQTINFDQIGNKVYGDTFALDASSSSQLDVSYEVTSGPATVSNDEVTITGVGEVTITANQAGNDTYNPAQEVTQTFNVSKATLTVTADDQTINQGDEMPTLTFEYVGFVNGEDASVIDTPPTINTQATQSSDAGEYSIELTGGSDDHYDFVYENGILTIDKVTGIEENILSGVQIYPIPFVKTFQIVLPQEAKDTYTLTINTLDGRQILNRQLNSVQTTHEIYGLENISKGIYIVQLAQNGTVKSYKIVKKTTN